MNISQAVGKLLETLVIFPKRVGDWEDEYKSSKSKSSSVGYSISSTGKTRQVKPGEGLPSKEWDKRYGGFFPKFRHGKKESLDASLRGISRITSCDVCGSFVGRSNLLPVIHKPSGNKIAMCKKCDSLKKSEYMSDVWGPGESKISEGEFTLGYDASHEDIADEVANMVKLGKLGTNFGDLHRYVMQSGSQATVDDTYKVRQILQDKHNIRFPEHKAQPGFYARGSLDASWLQRTKESFGESLLGSTYLKDCPTCLKSTRHGKWGRLGRVMHHCHACHTVHDGKRYIFPSATALAKTSSGTYVGEGEGTPGYDLPLHKPGTVVIIAKDHGKFSSGMRVLVHHSDVRPSGYVYHIYHPRGVVPAELVMLPQEYADYRKYSDAAVVHTKASAPLMKGESISRLVDRLVDDHKNVDNFLGHYSSKIESIIGEVKCTNPGCRAELKRGEYACIKCGHQTSLGREVGNTPVGAKPRQFKKWWKSAATPQDLNRISKQVDRLVIDHKITVGDVLESQKEAHDILTSSNWTHIADWGKNKEYQSAQIPEHTILVSPNGDWHISVRGRIWRYGKFPELRHHINRMAGTIAIDWESLVTVGDVLSVIADGSVRQPDRKIRPFYDVATKHGWSYNGKGTTGYTFSNSNLKGHRIVLMGNEWEYTAGGVSHNSGSTPSELDDYLKNVRGSESISEQEPSVHHGSGKPGTHSRSWEFKHLYDQLDTMGLKHIDDDEVNLVRKEMQGGKGSNLPQMYQDLSQKTGVPPNGVEAIVNFFSSQNPKGGK